ncbi:hypothetical protein Esti_000899 [Eimeria stiedai]
MPTEARHDLIRTPAAQQTKPVVKGRRLEYSGLSTQHQAPPARQPREEVKRIPERVDERMSAAERQPSPQQDKRYATLVAALKEALRGVKTESSTSNDQSSNDSSAGFTGSLKKPRQCHGQGPREWLAQLEQYHLLLSECWRNHATTTRSYMGWLLKRLAKRFAAVLAKGVPPPQTDLVLIFMNRIPFRLVRLVCHQHFDTWIAAKDALHRALVPEQCARELWPAISEQHSKDCKPELMVNQQASHAGRSTIASAVPSELKNPQQANAQLNAVATNCSSAQSPLDQAVHVKLSQQTVRQPSDSLLLWWRHVHQNVPLVFLAQAPHEARLAGLRVNRMGQGILALLDSGATRSFVSPPLVDELQLQTKPPQESTYLMVAMVSSLTCLPLYLKCPSRSAISMSGRFLLAPVAYPLILGLDEPRGLRAVWPFGHDRITILRGGRRFNLSMAPRGQPRVYKSG